MAVRRFVDHEVMPAAPAAWDAAEMSWDVIRRLPDLGVVGDDIAVHGCAGLDPLTSAWWTWSSPAATAASRSSCVVQSGLAMKTIDDARAPRSRRSEFLPAMARLETIGAFGLTEPEHGSDSVSLETTARRDGDDWVIDGAQALDRQRQHRRPDDRVGPGHRDRERARASSSTPRRPATRRASSRARGRCARCGRPTSISTASASRSPTGCRARESFNDTGTRARHHPRHLRVDRARPRHRRPTTPP